MKHLAYRSGAFVASLITLLAAGSTGFGQTQQEFAYVADSLNSTISQYRIGPDGSFTPLAPATVPASRPYAMSPHPAGSFLYAVNNRNGTVSQYRVNENGTLAPLSPATVPTGSGDPGGSNPLSIAVHPRGGSAYVVNNADSTVSQYRVNADGTLAPLSPPTVPTGPQPLSVAVHPGGSVVYVTHFLGRDGSAGAISQYRVNANGTLTLVSDAPVGAGDKPSSVAVHPTGNFAYVVNSQEEPVTVLQYRVGTNGALTPLSPAKVVAGSPKSMQGGMSFITTSPDGRSAYVVNNTEGTVWSYEVGADGRLQKVDSIRAGRHANSVAVHPNGGSIYAGGRDVLQSRIGAGGRLTAPSRATAAGNPSASLQSAIVVIRR